MGGKGLAIGRKADKEVEETFGRSQSDGGDGFSQNICICQNYQTVPFNHAQDFFVCQFNNVLFKIENFQRLSLFLLGFTAFFLPDI